MGERGHERLCVRMLFGAGLRLDRSGVGGLCRASGARLGLRAEAEWCDDEPALIASLEAARSRGEAIVLCPGGLGDREAVREAAAAEGAAPLVWLDLRVALEPRDRGLQELGVATIRGRGLEGIRWAVEHLAARAAWPVATERYGDDPEQVGDLRLPASGEAPHPVCVVLHGGSWRERWERDLMDGLAVDLARRGYATWNLEYRRVGPSGGGWPATCADVAAGIDALEDLAERHPLDLDRVVLVGHSAGGHLSAWAAARAGLPAGAPGAGPRVSPRLIVPLAGVFDLAETARRGLDEMSTIAFMGATPEDDPEAYALASPAERLPLGVPQLVVCGTADRPDLVDDNRVYCSLARAAGDDVDYLELPGADHFDVIDPRSLPWLAIADRLGQALGRTHELATTVHDAGNGGSL